MDLRSGHPFWLVNNGLIANYPAITNDETCDVAIIGAGITGALLAHSLTEAGMSTVVLDERDVATGSTVASTALLQYEIDTELHSLIELIGIEPAVRAYRLGLEAIARIESLTKSFPTHCEFEPRDSFYFASRNGHRKQIQREFECRRDYGFDVEFWESDRIATEFPFAAPAGILSRGDAVIDAFQFTHALLRKAAETGCRIYDRTRMASFVREGDGFRIVTDRGPTVLPRKLIFATGYASHQYLKRSRGRLFSTYAAISEPMAPLPPWPGHCLLWESARPYFYLRTTSDNRILIGGEDTDYSSDHRSERRLANKAERLVGRFGKLMPGVAFDVAYTWAGTFGESDDGLAYIGEEPGQPDVLFALGFGGNGITMSVIAAKILTDACRGIPNTDAALYRLDR